MTRLIYDFGMNNGDDTDYYLRKGARVVAVEANPALCAGCTARFAAAIADQRLVILNVALGASASDQPITFYVHRRNHVLSRVHPPKPERQNEFDAVMVPERTASTIVHQYGWPHYVKLDVEGLDAAVLRDLFQAGIHPDFISAEAGSVEPFALLVAEGYTAFNLVEGATVRDVYRNATISTANGPVTYSFPHHSAGPYGEDLRSPWWDADAFLTVLAVAQLGWKDVHASRVLPPTPQQALPRPPVEFRSHVTDIIPSFCRALKARLGRSHPISGIDC